MPTWYVLVTAKPESEHSVYTSLAGMNEVEYLYPLFGEWDLIFKIQHDDEAVLKSFILEKIKPIDGILATKTLIGY